MFCAPVPLPALSALAGNEPRTSGWRSATLLFRSHVGNGLPCSSAFQSFSIGGLHSASVSGPRGSARHNRTWQPQASANAWQGVAKAEMTPQMKMRGRYRPFFKGRVFPPIMEIAIWVSTIPIMVRLVPVLVALASTALAFLDFFRGVFAKDHVYLTDTRASLLDEFDGNIKALPELRAS